MSLNRFCCFGMSPVSQLHFCPQAILSSSSKDSNSHKDDGLFKAPPPPPKVIKSETIPTRLNQDIVTALKCRKEDKEVSPGYTDLLSNSSCQINLSDQFLLHILFACQYELPLAPPFPPFLFKHSASEGLAFI